jgi:hypothetical protein
MMGDIRFYVVGCYIPPSNLETLTHINKTWCACPKGVHPILVVNLNINLCAPRTEHKETIAKQVDAMDLIDLSRHFYQRSGTWLQERWILRMRREVRWVSSQWDYFLGRETNGRRFQHVSIKMPCYYSNHCALAAVIYAEGVGELKRYRNGPSGSPSPSPGPRMQLNTKYKDLQWDVVPPHEGAPRQQLDHRKDVENHQSSRIAT